MTNIKEIENSIKDRRIIFIIKGAPLKIIKIVAKRYSVFMDEKKFIKMYYEKLTTPSSFMIVNFDTGRLKFCNDVE